MQRILLIGGTGNVGKHVAAALPGARVVSRRTGTDLTVPESLEPHLESIDTVFLVWTAPREAFAPAFERIARRARRIVFLSAPLKTPPPFLQQPNPLRDTTEEIEGRIQSSGLEWTFVRPGMFA